MQATSGGTTTTAIDWASLPIDLIAHCLDLVEDPDRGAARSCRSWHDALAFVRHFTGVRSLHAALTMLKAVKNVTLIGDGEIGARDIEALVAIGARLRSLDLAGANDDRALALTLFVQGGVCGALELLNVSRWMHIVDCTFTRSMTSLQVLNMSHTSVRDIRHLAQLPALRCLDVSHTPLRDIVPLLHCTSLQTLDISATRVHDLSCLAAHETLVVMRCCLLINQVSLPLRLPRRLCTLELCHSNYVDDVHALDSSARIVHLTLRATRVADISVVARLPLLRTIDLASTHINSIDVLRRLRHLEQLNLSDTRITNIDSLMQYAGRLTNLDISRTKIHDIGPIRQMHTTLIALDIEHTHVSDLTPLHGFTRLLKLHARFSRIADLAPLATCRSLRILDCSHTDVASIACLNTCKALRSLNATFTNVADAADLTDHCPLLADLQFCCTRTNSPELHLCLHDKRQLMVPDDADLDHPMPGTTPKSSQRRRLLRLRLRFCTIV